MVALNLCPQRASIANLVHRLLPERTFQVLRAERFTFHVNPSSR